MRTNRTIALLLAMALVLLLGACGFGKPNFVDTAVDGVEIPVKVTSSGSSGKGRHLTTIRLPRCPSSSHFIALSNLDGNVTLQAFAILDLKGCDDPYEEGDLAAVSIRIPSTALTLSDGYCFSTLTQCETPYGRQISG
ncbi:MAG: hypothetical protein V3V01_13335 [Acidimicrobiales bacterium]